MTITLTDSQQQLTHNNNWLTITTDSQQQQKQPQQQQGQQQWLTHLMNLRKDKHALQHVCILMPRAKSLRPIAISCMLTLLYWHIYILYTDWHNCTFASLHIFILALLHTCTFTHLHIYTLAHLQTCTFAYLHIFILAHLHQILKYVLPYL